MTDKPLVAWGGGYKILLYNSEHEYWNFLMMSDYLISITSPLLFLFIDFIVAHWFLTNVT